MASRIITSDVRTTRAALALTLLLLCCELAGAQQLLGPTPYLRFLDSPFATLNFECGYFHLENFEDGLLNVPGVSPSTGAVIGPSNITDSVDADDTFIDGSGTNGHSYWASPGGTGITFTFNGAVLGGLPTHVGIVWTDHTEPITFEAFDENCVSLGTVVGYHESGADTGETGEDRFYGVVNPGGICKIRIKCGGTGNGIEVDHLQYGRMAGCICGRKFYDLNCNGVDDGEPGLAGWQINLVNNSTGAAQSITTIGNGSYCFNNLIPGSYSVFEQAQPFWKQSFPNPSGTYSVQVNNNKWMNADFGNCYCSDVRPNLNHALYTEAMNCWQVMREPSTPSGSPPPPRPVSQVNPLHASWTPGWWVSASSSYGGTAPPGEYEYQCCFCLDSGFTNAQLAMSLTSDDTSLVYLNDTLIGTVAPGPAVLVTWSAQAEFRPGWNCVKIIAQNTGGATGFCVHSGAVTATNGQCCETFRKDCVSPPAGMIGWWPLDEKTGPTANDIAGPDQDASWVGSPAPSVGAVSGSLSFGGTSAATIAPGATADVFNVGTGDFSIDAWIKMPTTAGTGTHVIVEKGMAPSFAFVAYQLYVLNGKLTFNLAGFQVVAQVNSPLLNDNRWHHVAVTVIRESLTGLKLYVDGVPTTFDSTLGDYNLDTGGDFSIGQLSSSVGRFNGRIDEVQFFKRALTPAEVIGIYYAQSEGKCRDRCDVPPVSTYWNGMNTVAVSVEICNHSTQTATYSFAFTPNAGISGICSAAGSFSPSPFPAPVSVLAGQCEAITFNIPMPAGISNPGQFACYEICVTNMRTGVSRCCYGTLLNQEDIARPPDEGDNGKFVIGVPVGETKTVRFVFVDEGFATGLGGDFSANYIVRAAKKDNVDNRADEASVPSCTGHDSTGLPCKWVDDPDLSIAGMPNGIPLTGAMTFAGPGATATVELEVTANGFDPFRSDWLVLSVDANNDGNYEPIRCTRLIVSPWATGDVNCDGVISMGDISAFVLALLNPSAFHTTYAGCDVTHCDSNGDGRVDGGDCQTLIELLLNS